MGFCSFASDHQHGKDNAPCQHFHQSENSAENLDHFHGDCHQKKKEQKQNDGEIHCHTCQIIVCLNDFTIFISTLNYQPFFENSITSFISHVSTRIDHIPIYSS